MNYRILMDLLFPTRCVFCGKLTERETFCNQCQTVMPWNLSGGEDKKDKFFNQCIAPLRYKDSVVSSFHRYKFASHQSYAKEYARLMSQCVIDRLDMSPDMITWAPISKSRRRRRGYDQSQLLAQELGHILQIPVHPTLKKCRHTQPQSNLHNPEERRENALGAYQINAKISVHGCRILLVDDIVTSGSTLSECARILRAHGALEISCVVLARA